MEDYWFSNKTKLKIFLERLFFMCLFGYCFAFLFETLKFQIVTMTVFYTSTANAGLQALVRQNASVMMGKSAVH